MANTEQFGHEAHVAPYREELRELRAQLAAAAERAEALIRLSADLVLRAERAERERDEALEEGARCLLDVAAEIDAPPEHERSPSSFWRSKADEMLLSKGVK